MKNEPCARAVLVTVACIFLVLGSSGHGQTEAVVSNPAHKEAVMTRASGTFDVKLSPQPMDNKADASLGRMSLDKQFHGDLEATSKGEMLSASTSVKGSAGYVAIERVSGTLHGRSGSFTLQHSGTMTRGAPQLTITVVPDSGTDQLKGLAGKMMITITHGKHSYDFEYTLAESP
jgi:Protein of unknown function (DUF3224)